MRAVILEPFRPDGAERDEIERWTRARWRAVLPELELYAAPGPLDGLFSRAAALNEAAAAAGDWDFAVVVDADVFIDPANVRAALERAAATGKVTWAFQRWNGLTHDATETIIRTGGSASGADLRTIEPRAIEKTNPISWSCCFVVPRAVWDDVGGFDERFRGWGWEDMAFQSVVCGLYGHERVDGDVYHLAHPRAEERIRRGQPDGSLQYRLNRMLGRRYMYALRVLGLHDRATDSDEAEMERDRANILRLARAEELQFSGRPRDGLPDWRAWWPTLDELRDGARERRSPGPVPQLAIVMRSGGLAENWPARRGYLEQALASLKAHVQYRAIAARVIFSDWPEPIGEELRAIADRHGFYVVGQGNRGFTAAMAALWRYLGTRGWPYEYAFLTEDDFVIERDVDLGEMAEVLAANPHLVQVALLRDAFYQAERDAGGILGHPIVEFDDVDDGRGHAWLEHRRFFTLNPTLVRRSLFARPWPAAQHSEAVFGRQLFAADPDARSALWGAGESWIRHLGEVRAGVGY